MRLWRRRESERDLERELHSHLDVEAEEREADGLPPDLARYAAQRALGNTTLVQEEVREMWGWASLDRLEQDVRYGLRALRKSPAFTLVAVLSLALGIGANTAIFSLIDAVLLKLLPIRDPQSLMFLAAQEQTGGSSASTNFYFETYQRLRAEQAFFQDLAAFSQVRLNVRVNGQLEPSVLGQLVSGNYFTVLGVSAVAGRAFTEDDDRNPGGHPVAMIGYQYWQRRFGLSSSAIGQEIFIDGTPFTIVGVTPPGFLGLEVGSAPAITVPLTMQPQVMPDKENWLIRSNNTVDWLKLFGRLKPGVTRERASSGMRAIYSRVQIELASELNSNWQQTWLKPWAEARLLLQPGGAGVSDLRRKFSRPLFVLMGMVGLVLLIACANVANLLLGRASARQRDIAVRMAIGAGRLRLMRQLLVESLLLGCMGGALGVLFANWTTTLLVHFLSAGRTPITLDLHPDLRVLSFTAVVSVGAAVLFGLAPALHAVRIDLTPALKEGQRSASANQRVGETLAAVQIAVSLVLVISAGLFVRSLQKLNGVDGGFQRDHVLTVRLEPRGSDEKRGANALRLNRLYLDLQERVQSIAGVTAASFAGGSPTAPLQLRTFVTPDGRQFRASRTQVYPKYFATLGARILQGRDFELRDVADAAPFVAVINQKLARSVFPNENPIGKQIVCSGRAACEVIGVVEEIRYANLKGEVGNAMYQTFLQAPTGRGQMVLHVRFIRDPERMTGEIRRRVAGIDPNLPAFEIETLATEVDATLVRERMLALLSTAFGALALLLAGIGLYGVIAYATARRTKELGIRMALGATQSGVRLLILRKTLRVAGIGILLGLPVALGTARLIASFLFGLTAADPAVLVVSVAFLFVTGLVAGYLPAQRASRVDPMVALRYE
jgi:predicted permease